MRKAALALMRSPRAARLIAALAAALIAAYAVTWITLSHVGIGRSDFTAKYSAGLLLREGRSADVYNVAAQSALRAQLIAPDRDGAMPFVDAPPSALLIAPVTLLDLDTAYRLWSLLQLTLLLVAVLIAVRSAPWPATTPRAWKIAAATAALASMGTWVALIQGQWTPLTALGIALAYRAWRRGQLATGGALLVLMAGAAKPHLALGLLAFALGWRDRRLLAGSAAGAAVLAIASVALVGPAGVGAFIGDAFSQAGQWDVRGMVSFIGVPGAILGSGVAAQLIAAGASLVACALAWRLGALVRRDPSRLDAALAAAAVLSLLAAPHAYWQDLVMLAPVMAWSVAVAAQGRPSLPGRDRQPRARTAVVFGLWGLLSAAGFAGFADRTSAIAGQLAAWALLLAAAAASAEAWGWRRSRGGPAPVPNDRRQSQASTRSAAIR